MKREEVQVRKGLIFLAAGERKSPTHNSWCLVRLYVLRVFWQSPRSCKLGNLQAGQNGNQRLRNAIWIATGCEYGDLIWLNVLVTSRRRCGWFAIRISFTPFSHDAWHDITAEFHVDGNVTIWHDALTIDGQRFAPTMHNSHAAVTTTHSNTLNNAFQLDTDQFDDSYTFYVDAMDVTYTP